VSDPRAHLAALAAALPADGTMTVPVAWVRQLLSDSPIGERPAESVTTVTPADDPLLTPDEVAKRFGLSRAWLYRHWKAIPGAVKLSRKALRFPLSGVKQYLDGRRANAA
jgi:predicted DNA-binding transcriptional regulator AlpA